MRRGLVRGMEKLKALAVWGALLVAAGCGPSLTDAYGGASGEPQEDAGRAEDAGSTQVDGNSAQGDAGSQEDAGSQGDAGSTQDAGGEGDSDAGPVVEGSEGSEGELLEVCPCFAGEGVYCGATVLDLMSERNCVLGFTPTSSDLVRCEGAAWGPEAACEHGCGVGGSPSAAQCSLAECPCFVRSAWCGAGAAQEGLGMDPPCRVPLSPDHDGDLLGCRDGAWVVQKACQEGCFQAPTGVPDECQEDRAQVTPQDPGWEDCPDRGLLHYGLHPEASDRIRCAGVTSGQITQTIGNAPASAGYHAQDGSAGGEPYCAAVDLSVRGLNEDEIRALLERLGRNGFVAWYRKPGYDGWPSDEAPHIHGVFAGVPMKAALRGQVDDFLIGRNGLASHRRYEFWQPDAQTLEIIRLLYARNY